MKRTTVLAVVVLLFGLFVPATTAVAQPPASLWVADTTLAGNADADTVTFFPIRNQVRFTATAWSLALTDSASDTTTCVAEFFAYMADTTSRHRQVIVTTKEAPRFSGRLDSLKVYLPAGRELVRLRFGAVDRGNTAPDFGVGGASASGVTLTAPYLYGNPTGYLHTLTGGSATSTDSLPGGTAKYSVPIVKFLIETDVLVYYNYTKADGDTNATVLYVPANGSIVLDDLDLYQVHLYRSGSDSNVQLILWPGGFERTAP